MKRKQRKSERRKEMRYLFNLNQGRSVKQQALIHRTSPLFTPQVQNKGYWQGVTKWYRDCLGVYSNIDARKFFVDFFGI